MTARSTRASWKDSTVWYRQRRPRQGAIEHSKTSGPLSICLQENWTIAKSAYPLEVRKNLKKYKPEYEHKGDLTAAYKNIKALLNLDPAAKDYPESIKQILTGLSSIVSGLATMRNEMSDAHARRYKPEKHHAKLAGNASKTLSEFLLGSLVKQF